MRINFGYFLFFSLFFQFSLSSISEYYCGYKNCYKILNVSKEATQQEIKKSFRELSKKFHPDKSRARGENDTTEIFKEINQAYDVLMNPEIRESYDDYLANPDKGDAYHYYNWYKATYMPKLDPRIVVSTIVVVFSLLQYVIRKGMYQHAISCIEKTSKFKTALNAKYEEEKKTKTKDEIRLEMLKNLKIEGGYSDPRILDLLLFQLIYLPMRVFLFFYFYVRWFYKFTVMKHPYGESEKEYLTYRNLGFSQKQWQNYLEAEQREYYLSLNLWDHEEYVKFMKEQEKTRQEKMGSSAKYKQYKRLLKNKKL